ncbi:MAG: radical SAM protein [Nitrospirae bacterium]|nr:radical SAM protein [Nitrospirota bacterium]
MEVILLYNKKRYIFFVIPYLHLLYPYFSTAKVELLIPKWDNVNLDIYPKAFDSNIPLIPIYTTRGCPFTCRYCSVTSLFGNKFRTKPVANVLKEIDSMESKAFFFVDDNIVGKPDYARELFKSLIKHDKKIKWHSQASTTILKNPELIELAAKSGCFDLFIGIETLNPDSLKGANKAFNKVEEYSELFKLLRKHKILPHPSIIFGFDDDTPETFVKIADFLLENKIYYADFYILTPLPGTPLFKEFDESKKLLHKDWSKYDANHVVIRPINLSIKELHDNYWKINRMFRHTNENIFDSENDIPLD